MTFVHPTSTNERSLITYSRPGWRRLSSVEPEQRLTDEKVSYHFLDAGVGREAGPRLEIRRTAQGHGCKKQAALPHRPVLVVHDVRRPLPSASVLDERHHEGHRAWHAAAIRELERPQVLFRRRRDLADCR